MDEKATTKATEARQSERERKGSAARVYAWVGVAHCVLYSTGLGLQARPRRPGAPLNESSARTPRLPRACIDGASCSRARERTGPGLLAGTRQARGRRARAGGRGGALPWPCAHGGRPFLLRPERLAWWRLRQLCYGHRQRSRQSSSRAVSSSSSRSTDPRVTRLTSVFRLALSAWTSSQIPTSPAHPSGCHGCAVFPPHSPFPCVRVPRNVGT